MTYQYILYNLNLTSDTFAKIGQIGKIVLKSETRLSYSFCHKNPILKHFMPYSVTFKSHCSLCGKSIMAKISDT